MKKISLILMALLLTAPAWATVYITCTSDGNVVTVSYKVVGEPNKVRAFALDVNADSGAIITDVNDDISDDYFIYPGSIVITDGTVTDYGHAWADPCDLPGDTLGGPNTPGITVEMGALYSPPTDDSPNSPPNDIGGQPVPLFKFTVSKKCCVTIKENAGRGGVVLTDPARDPDVNSPGCCMQPACWGYTCFPCGDASGDCFITSTDLMVLVNAWPPKAYNACADFSKDGFVTSTDLMILVNHWPPKVGCPEPQCGPCTPIGP